MPPRMGLPQPLPATWVVAGLLSNAVLLRWRGVAAVPFASMALGVAFTVALALRVGASLSDYYPSKMLWLGAVLGVPAVWVVGAWASEDCCLEALDLPPCRGKTDCAGSCGGLRGDQHRHARRSHL